MIGAFLAVNLLTLTRFPSVWVDEIQFADPAVRLASGQGFTSTAWFGQDAHHFFAGNVPLYSGLLGGWLSMVGPGLLAGRIFNLVLFTGILALLWRFMLRSQLVPSPRWRMVALVLLATGHAMTFSYRTGRYDVLGIFVAAVCMNLWIDRRRFGWLALAGLFIPAAGLQLLPAVLLACVLLMVLAGRPAVRRSALLLAGCAAGVAALDLLYRSFGVWQDFQRSTHSIGVMGMSIWQKLLDLPVIYMNDKSRALLLVAMALLLALGRRELLEGRQSRFLIGVLAFAVLLPVGMQMAGKFPIYYGWMIFVPLAIAFAGLTDSVWGSCGVSVRLVSAALLALAMVAGLPLRTASALSAWQDRDPRRVDAFVRANVAPGETALADFRLYYALRTVHSPTILPTYIPALGAEDRSRITVLLLRPEDVAAARQALGDEWLPTGAQFAPPRSSRLFSKLVSELREESYTVAVYRRADSAPLLIAGN